MGDAVGICVLVTTLLVLSYLQSRGRMFWGDEVMGNYVLHAGSLSRFLALWRAGIDSSGLWFYALAKPWELVFGPTEVSIRMFSAAGVAIAAVLVWVTARRFYELPVVVVALATPLLDIGVLRWQLSNGRSYGLFLTGTALVVYLIARGAEDLARGGRWLFLALTFFAYDLLTGGHILGVVYAVGLLAVQVTIDLRNRRSRPAVYLSAALGIAVVELLSLGNLHSTLAVGKPVFWTVRPHFRSVFLLGDVTESPVLTTALLLVALVALRFRRQVFRDPVYLILLGFLVLHTTMFAISRVATSIYVDRYLLPLTVAVVLVYAELLTQVREMALGRWRYAAVLGLVALAAVSHAFRLSQLPMPLRDYTNALVADLPAGVPVVDTDVGSFVEVEHYHHGRFGRPFLFPLDAAVTGDTSYPGGVSGFNEMNNFARLGVYAPDLQPTADILARYSRFAVITGGSPTSWLQRRILSNSAYTVTKLSSRTYQAVPFTIWAVQRR